MDVPIALWLSVFLGACGVAGLVAGLAWRAEGRAVALGIVGWLAADVALGAAGAFAADPDTRVPVIAFGIMVPLVAGTWLLARSATVAGVARRVPLRGLIGVQAYRAIGGVFIVAWAIGRMPGVFALAAGIADVAVGVAAPFVARRIDRDPVGGRRAAVVWNLAGIADLVLAVTLGFLSSPSAFQQLALSDPNWLVTRMPFVLVPVFAVPLSVLLHVVGLRRLGTTIAGTGVDAGTRVDAGTAGGAVGDDRGAALPAS